jgi:hypothetical protein
MDFHRMERRILGAHLVAPHADEVINLFGLSMTLPGLVAFGIYRLLPAAARSSDGDQVVLREIVVATGTGAGSKCWHTSATPVAAQ